MIIRSRFEFVFWGRYFCNMDMLAWRDARRADVQMEGCGSSGFR